MNISTSYIDRIVNGAFVMTDLVRNSDEESLAEEFTSEFDDELPTTVNTEQDPEVRVELLEEILAGRIHSLVSMCAELPPIEERRAILYRDFSAWLKWRAWARYAHANNVAGMEAHDAWYAANCEWTIDTTDPMHDKFEDSLSWAYDLESLSYLWYGSTREFVAKGHRLDDEYWRTRAGREAENTLYEWLRMEGPEDVTEREAWLREVLPRFTAACWRAGDMYHKARREKTRKQWLQENPSEMTVETIDNPIAVPFKVDAEGAQLFKWREDALLKKLETLSIQGRIEAMLDEIGESFAGFYVTSSKRALNGEDEIDPSVPEEELKSRLVNELEIMDWQVEQANVILTEWLATRQPCDWDLDDVVESMQFERWLQTIWPKFLAADRAASVELERRKGTSRNRPDNTTA